MISVTVTDDVARHFVPPFWNLGGNWGNDFTLLVKASKDAGLAVDYYTYYAGAPGMLTVLGEAALGYIKNASLYDTNPQNDRAERYIAMYRGKYKEDLIFSPQGLVIEILAQAMNQAGSTDPGKVAARWKA